MKINENYNITTEDVLTSIKNIDEKLSMAKSAWEDSPVNKKQKWMDQINKLLDGRHDLMVLRDKYCS